MWCKFVHSTIYFVHFRCSKSTLQKMLVSVRLTEYGFEDGFQSSLNYLALSVDASWMSERGYYFQSF